jgi:two-component system sensor histidine kinase KdpD
MVFIVAVVLVASRTRMAAAVTGRRLCFLAYNFFFIEPRFTLFIGARQGVATVFLFLAAALVAGPAGLAPAHAGGRAARSQRACHGIAGA